MKARCPHCLKAVERLRVYHPSGFGSYAVEPFERAYIDPAEPPGDLHIWEPVGDTADPATPGAMRLRSDGTEGPYVLPHTPRCIARKLAQ